MPPLNLQHGVFAFNGKQGESVQRIAFSSATSVKVLDSGPKQFRRTFYTPLRPAATPQLVAHMASPASSSATAGKQLATRLGGTPITFDHKTPSFVMARPLVVGNQTAMVTQRFGGRVEPAGVGSRPGATSGAISTAIAGRASSALLGTAASGSASRSAIIGASGSGGVSHAASSSGSFSNGGASHASSGGGGSAHH